MAVIEEADSPTVNGRRKGGSSAKKGGDGAHAGTSPKSRKLRDMMKVGMIGL